jgi:hypothetical protein
VPNRERTWRHKAREARYRARAVVPHMWWVVCEFSGSFFYLLVVIGSSAAVWFSLTCAAG